jgi:hypothetical protein
VFTESLVHLSFTDIHPSFAKKNIIYTSNWIIVFTESQAVVHLSFTDIHP